MSELGFTGDDERYLDWLAQLPPGQNMPLQTVYRVDGGTEATLRQRDDVNGYRESRPVQFGNPAFHMPEIGSFGFLADCVWTYVERGGKWKEEYWQLIRRVCRLRRRTLARAGLRHLGVEAALFCQQPGPVLGRARPRDQDRRAGRAR